MSRKKTVLITGASAGIGCELAQIFARDGYHLVLVARSGDRLQKQAEALAKAFGVSVKVLVKDLCLPRSPSEIFIELQKEGIDVDVLVNNAGFGNHGFFTETDLDNELDMLQLNIVALTHLTKLFLQPMIKRGEGRILNVASTAAFQPGPLMAVYYASKAYVLSFSEALWEELRGTGVTVTCLCPGPTASEFQSRAGLKDLLLLKGGMMTSGKVAEIGYRGLMKGKRVVIPGLKNTIAAFLAGISPHAIVLRVVRTLQSSRSPSRPLPPL